MTSPSASLALDLVTPILSAADGGDERAVLTAATRAATALLGERGSCILLDGQPRVMMATHAPALTNWPIDLERYPEIALALEQRSVIAIDDVRTDARLERVRTLLPSSLASVVVVPMRIAKRRLGVLVVQSTSPRVASREALEAAAMVGRLTAHLVDRLRLLSDETSEAHELPAFASGDTQPVAIVGSRPASIAATPTRRRVLVVDDDETQCATIKLVLEENGYEVVTAKDGLSGVAHARDTRPDLILLDVNMPVLDGFGAAERLHEDPLTASVPLLFFSACDDLMLRVRGLKLGAADFLPKPCFTPELLARIDRAIEHANFRRHVHEQTHVDELTGLGNLRALRDRLGLEQTRRDRHPSALAIAVIDLDRLKQINDRNGHAVGSRVIAAVGEALRSTTRASDLAVRYGGDEFVVVLPHTNAVDGLRFAERLLATIAMLRVGDVTPSISVGVAALEEGESGDVDGLLKRADAAAYEAKRAGGGCASLWRPDPPSSDQPGTPSELS